MVKNLHVEGDIKNDTPQPAPTKGVFTGGIAAVNYGQIIECTFSGNIVHTQPWGVGGIAGTNYNLVMGCGYIGAEGKKIYCPDSTNPSIGVGIMGGIVGMHNAYGANVYVIACYNTGSMESAAAGRMGGIVGEAFGDDPNPYHAVVVGCNNRGTMVSRAGIGSGDVGGIAAYSAWGHTLVACYSTATITNTNGKLDVGGIMGSCDSSNDVLPSNAISCYWLNTTHDNASNNGLGSVVKDCVSKTAAQLKSAAVITSLNEAIAEYNEGAFEKCPYVYVGGSDGYPVLKSVN